MTTRQDIQSFLRSVISDLGEAWAYKRRTSGPTAPPTYDANWTTVQAHATGHTTAQEFDDRRQAMKRTETASLRLLDTVTRLHDGDIVQDPETDVWYVLGIASRASRTGTVRYLIQRDVPMRAEPQRGGSL
jgi:hypothetical protein